MEGNEIGSMIAIICSRDEDQELYVVSRTRGTTWRVAENVFSASWSPSTSRLALTKYANDDAEYAELMVADAENATIMRMGDDEYSCDNVLWSKAGHILYEGQRKGSIVERPRPYMGTFAITTGDLERKLLLESLIGPAEWSPDGNRICFVLQNMWDGDICILDYRTGDSVTVTRGATKLDFSPTWIDDRTLAFVRYVRLEGALGGNKPPQSQEVVVATAPKEEDGSVRTLVTIPVHEDSVLQRKLRVSRDGRWILYSVGSVDPMKTACDVYVVDVETGKAHCVLKGVDGPYSFCWLSE